MIRYSTRIFLTIIWLSFFASVQAQISPIPTGSFKIKGVVGHPEIVRPGNAPTGLMVAAMPADQVKSECTFFGGDSLKGFDFDKASKQKTRKCWNSQALVSKIVCQEWKNYPAVSFTIFSRYFLNSLADCNSNM